LISPTAQINLDDVAEGKLGLTFGRVAGAE
jgi:hypothetical protein